MNLKYIVNEETNGATVKHILKNKLGLSTNLVNKLKRFGKIYKNSMPVYVNEVVKTNDIVEAIIDFDEDSENVVPEPIDIDILYEDDLLIALNKPANMVVHPTSLHTSGTMANALMHYFNSKNLNIKIRPVSRLDRDTSGIIVFAKNQYIQAVLTEQMQNNLFKKYYFGIVHGHVDQQKGTIDLPIERKPDSIMLRHVSPSGSPSVTHYEVIEYLNGATFLKFDLETGRTHQIRVHCQAIGHPLLGDTLYSDFSTDLISRQALHSGKVIFVHPHTKKNIELSAPLPDDMLNCLEILRK